MEKVLLIDDESSWMQKFVVAHEHLFKQHNLEIVNFTLDKNTTIDDVLIAMASPEISLVLLDEKLDSIPGINFTGKDIVEKFRNGSSKNIAIYIISNSANTFDHNFSIDGVYDKGGISSPGKKEFDRFEKEFERIARAAHRLTEVSKDTLARISILSKKKVSAGTLLESEEIELEGLKEQVQNFYPLLENIDRSELLSKLENEQKELKLILDKIASKIGS